MAMEVHSSVQADTSLRLTQDNEEAGRLVQLPLLRGQNRSG